MIDGLVILTFTFMAAWVGHFPVIGILKRAGMSNHCDATGRWVGYLERALITLFVATGHTTETVFIFATKAAFMGYRMPKDGDGKQTAEYMMIGTMASYITAVVLGLICMELLKSA